MHCPNAYCKQHKDITTTNTKLGSVCDEHEEEITFLEETVKLAEVLPNPCPGPEMLAAWRSARGILAVSTSVTASSDNTDTDSKPSLTNKQRKSRFSVDVQTDSSRSTSVAREGRGRSRSRSRSSESTSEIQVVVPLRKPVRATKIDLSPEAKKEEEEKEEIVPLNVQKVKKTTSKTQSPVRKPISPLKTVQNILQETLSPVKKLLSPVKKPPSPVKKPLSPVKKPPSPVRKPLSPDKKPLSPVKKPLSPVKKPLSPVKKPLSPVKNVECPISLEEDEQDTPSRRSRRDTSAKTLELTQILGNQNFLCKVSIALNVSGKLIVNSYSRFWVVWTNHSCLHLTMESTLIKLMVEPSPCMNSWLKMRLELR